MVDIGSSTGSGEALLAAPFGGQWAGDAVAAVVLGVILAAFYQNWSAGRELRKQREMVNQIGGRRLRNLSAGPRRR